MNGLTQVEEVSSLYAPHAESLHPQAAWHPAKKNGHLAVGITVDLFRGVSAGGHVKCWEHLAEAAEGLPVDLTVYFLAERCGIVSIAENVRYVLLQPMLSTGAFRFLDKIADHTDLAPLHPGLLRHLRQHHVLHTTDAYFSLAKTARHYARWARRPLVNSIHTDTPGYTRIYSAQILRRIFGGGLISRALCDRWHFEERLGSWMKRQLARYLRGCDWALASRRANLEDGESALPSHRFSILRRGIDKNAFHPGKRDRHRLKAALRIGEDRFVLLCVGRIDPGKNVITLARAARILLERGAPVHVVFAGEGSQTSEMQALLGDRVSLPGALPQAELGWLYASADLFAFPSQIEISPNAVVEAKASGLPVLVSATGGSRHLVHQSGRDGLVVDENDSFVWAQAIDWLRRDAATRRAMGEQARRSIDAKWPSWRDVLTEDLLPVWQRVARERGLLPCPA